MQVYAFFFKATPGDASHLHESVFPVDVYVYAFKLDDLFGVDLEGMDESTGLGRNGYGDVGVADIFDGTGRIVNLGDLHGFGVRGRIIDALEGAGLGERRHGNGIPLRHPEFLECLLGRVDGNLVPDDLPLESLGMSLFGDLELEVAGRVVFLLGVQVAFVTGMEEAHGAKANGRHGDETEDASFHNIMS